MAGASSVRPLFISQRGDSGMPNRARNRITAGMVLVPSMTRQPRCPGGHQEAHEERHHEPDVPGDLGQASSRPRSRAGANSAINGQPTEYSTPIATPISSRTKNSCQAESTKNCRTEPSDEEHHVDHEQRLAAEFVGQPAPERGADEDADQRGRGDQPLPQRRESRSSEIAPITGPMMPRM